MQLPVSAGAAHMHMRGPFRASAALGPRKSSHFAEKEDCGERAGLGLPREATFWLPGVADSPSLSTSHWPSLSSSSVFSEPPLSSKVWQARLAHHPLALSPSAL